MQQHVHVYDRVVRWPSKTTRQWCLDRKRTVSGHRPEKGVSNSWEIRRHRWNNHRSLKCHRHYYKSFESTYF